MAVEVRSFAATIPAGTTADAPVSVDLSFPARQVDSITVRVPPGPSGAVGFVLQNSGVTVIPIAGTDWIITDDEVITWALTDQITSGSWQLAGYNTGTYDHTVYIRFALSLPAAAGGGLLVPVAAADLTGSV